MAHSHAKFQLNSLVSSFYRNSGKMSTEEDPELRDLIAKCLETNGVLGKIRVNNTYILNVTVTYQTLILQAQLRANTFLALDQQDDPKVYL